MSGSVSSVVFSPFFFSEGRCLEKFSGANFCFWVSVLVGCFLCCFAYVFALNLVFRSRKCLEKILFWSGPLFGKIFGSELLFLGVGVVRVCFGAVLPMFLLSYLVSRSRKCLEKILLMSGFVFWGFFSLLLVFRRRRRLFLFCFFKRESSGSNRSHPHTHLFSVLFLVCVPAATGFISRFGRASFLSGVLSGCHSGPRAFWRFLGFFRYLGGF